MGRPPRLAPPHPTADPVATRRARWHLPVAIAVPVTVVAAAAVTGALIVGGARTTAPTAAGRSGPTEVGFLHVDRGVDAEFVQVQLSHGAITGTASQAAADNGAVVTARTPLTGELTGDRVDLRLSAFSAPWMFGAVTLPELHGTLANGVLTLTVVHPDASLEAVTFGPATVEAYDRAVEQISVTVAQAQQLRRPAAQAGAPER